EGSKTDSPVQCHLTKMTSLATPVDDPGAVGGLPVCANVPFAVEVTVTSADCDLECIGVADIDVRQQADDALCGAFVAQFVQIEHRDLRVGRGEVLAHTGMCGEDEFESADVIISKCTGNPPHQGQSTRTVLPDIVLGSDESIAEADGREFGKTGRHLCTSRDDDQSLVFGEQLWQESLYQVVRVCDAVKGHRCEDVHRAAGQDCLEFADLPEVQGTG